jgi:hypothetical protein
MFIVATTMGGELNVVMDLEEDGGRWHCSSAQIMPKRDQLGGLHEMEGQGGSGNDEQYIAIWQTSPEESPRDGKNCKKRCV